MSSRLTAVVVSVGVLLAGCADTGGGGGGGEGVAVGADIEEYRAAFEGVGQTSLEVQLGYGPENEVAKAWQGYAEAVSEWSGGKVELEFIYSNARASQAEATDAIADGLLDGGQVVPSLKAEEFPEWTALADLAFTDNSKPMIGLMQGWATMLEASAADEAIGAEFAQHDLVPFPAVLWAGGRNALFCRDEAGAQGDLRGLQVAPQNAANYAELEALGAVPVSLGPDEIYEALQRGVVDCMTGVVHSPKLYGFTDVTKGWAIDSQAQFAGSPNGVAFSKDVWDGLPRVTQQLLWDRLDVYYEALLEGVLADHASTLSAGVESGARITDLDPGARDRLAGYHEEVIEDFRADDASAARVETVLALSDEWETTIVDELGYPDDLTWDSFYEWYEQESPDMEPFVRHVMDEALAEYRP